MKNKSLHSCFRVPKSDGGDRRRLGGRFSVVKRNSC